MKKQDREKLIFAVANYIIETKSTLRKTGEEFGISKSTVHKYITKHLKELDYELYSKVQEILKDNWDIKCVHGGMQTRKNNEEKFKRYVNNFLEDLNLNSENTDKHNNVEID